MSKEETPSPGPELESVYVPGTPGARWTRGEVTTMRTILTMVTTAQTIVIVMVKILVKKMPKVMTMTTTDQVAATRMRVLQMIHPDWNVKKKQVGSIAEQKKQIYIFEH